MIQIQSYLIVDDSINEKFWPFNEFTQYQQTTYTPIVKHL